MTIAITVAVVWAAMSVLTTAVLLRLCRSASYEDAHRRYAAEGEPLAATPLLPGPRDPG